MKYLLFITLLTLAACSKEYDGQPLPIGTFVKVQECDKPYKGETQTIAFMDDRLYLNDQPFHVVRYDAPTLYWSFSFYEYQRSGKTLLTMRNDTLTLTGGMSELTGCEVAKFKLMH